MAPHGARTTAPSRPARGSGPPADGDVDHTDPDDADADPEAIARAICLRLLTGASKTRAQLATALARRRVPDEAAQRVLDRFVEVGLIDDAEFSRDWVSSRQARKGLSKRALVGELRARGVPDQVIDESVAGIGPEDELAAAKALVARKLASMGRVAPDVQTRRLAAMLGRKGYSGAVAMAAVISVVGDRDHG